MRVCLKMLGGGGFSGCCTGHASKVIFRVRTRRITYYIQSGDDEYLTNETMRKPTTGTQCPTLSDKCRTGYYIYMPNRTDTAGHTRP